MKGSFERKKNEEQDQMWVHNRRAGVKLMIEVERLRERGTEEMWRLCSVARLSAHAEKCNQKTNRNKQKKRTGFKPAAYVPI